MICGIARPLHAREITLGISESCIENQNTILKDLTADLKAKNTKLSIQVRKLDSEKKYIKHIVKSECSF
jgi:hypothetical protein